MNNVIIHAQGLSKKYVIGHEAERERYIALRDIVAHRASALLRTMSDMLHCRAVIGGEITEEIWALKDVNFEVRRGEVLGVIGRNGAGKSTLLKVLSRITEPSAGQVEIRGRVASLLEVGTGFHPELTGRENIYLNGAILGMSRAEIRRKFDEIVAFAEIEKFLDTPVKRYSSGMYVRLAFAVAAHLEPEILLIDEVLAVGDAEFQKRCLGRMQEIAAGGRTVLFVSHNMTAVLGLCSRVIHFVDGAVAGSGSPKEIVAKYLVSGGSAAQLQWVDDGAPGDDAIRLRKICLTNQAGQVTDRFWRQEPVSIHLEYEIFRRVRGLEIGLRISTADGTVALTTVDADERDDAAAVREPGLYAAQCMIPANLLAEQAYSVSVGAAVPRMHLHFFVEAAVRFTVANNGSGRMLDDGRLGVVNPIIPWSIAQCESGRSLQDHSPC